MFQPKRQTGSMPVNRLLTIFISGVVFVAGGFGVQVSAANASTPSANPTPEITSPAETSNPIPSEPPTEASSIWVVVNKQRPLNPITYTPAKFGSVNLAKPAADAFLKMKSGMKQAGVGTLILNSGFRSYNTQVGVHKKQVARYGLKAGEALAARPGYSEHQTGLAADVSALGQGCTIQVCFAKTKGGKWLAANSWKYGFILRYPDGQTATTGYQFEPWHFRYVGVELATEMKTQGVTVLEKFWQLPAAPSYNY